MSQIALPVPNVSLATAFEKWPMPWSVGRKFATPASGGFSADIVDVNGAHVLMCEAGLATAIVAAVKVLWLVGFDRAEQSEGGSDARVA